MAETLCNNAQICISTKGEGLFWTERVRCKYVVGEYSRWQERRCVVLFILNLMMETHCLVHLANGQVWTTLAKLSGDHIKDLSRCNIHLVYIGRGLFVELNEHQILLEVAAGTSIHVTSLIIGELSSPESKTIDQVMALGLGKAKTIAEDKKTTDFTTPTPSTSQETATPTSTGRTPKPDINVGKHSREKQGTLKIEEETQELVTCTPCTVSVKRLTPKMEIPHLVMPEELASCPQSAYRDPGYHQLLYNPILSDKDSVHSDSTENYWPEYAAEHPEILTADTSNVTKSK